MGVLSIMNEIELVAVCDPNEETRNAFAEKWRVKGYADFNAMLDDARLDIVFVASPMQFHTPQAIAAMDAGAHVMSEVPATVSIDECWALLAKVRETGRKYMMAENYCYQKNVVLVKSMVEAGMFGDVYYAEGAYIHELSSIHRYPDGTPTWRMRWQMGRNGNTYPTHSIGPCMQWIKERVSTLTCLGTGVRMDPAYVNEATTIMLCKTPSEKLITARLDMASPRPHKMNLYGLQGTKGAFETGRANGEQDRVWIDGRSPEKDAWEPLAKYESEFMPEIWRNPPEEAKRAGHGGGDYFVVREFVDSILNDTKPPIDVYDSLEMTVPGLVSEQSINSRGVPLPVPDFRTA